MPRRLLAFLAALALAACAGTAPSSTEAPEPFVVAMVPDTQNYLDYTHQKAEGFAIESSELFMQQMRWLAANGRARGGEIAFVASVGDVWQHQSEAMDEAHAARGIDALPGGPLADHFAPTQKVFEVEIPHAIAGYQLLLDAGIPFGIAPGNHDYDAFWSLAAFPPNPSPDPERFRWEDLGVMHVGGLDNFRSAFGDHTHFFRDADWYVSSFDGGTNSAQVFQGGGYRWLHVAVEMQPGDEVLAWVERVLAEHPGLPTILSTHDYLNPRGERSPVPILDFPRGDPGHHNDAEDLWRKLVSRHDQIFLVLCGHQHGQAFRVDANAAGHEVYQMLADYQDRGQVGLDAGQPRDSFFGGPVGIGDGWLRLLEFHMASEVPEVRVTTWSTWYEKSSSELDGYSAWYREHEQPGMSDAEFLAAEAFTVPLVDFRKRFGAPGAQAP